MTLIKDPTEKKRVMVLNLSLLGVFAVFIGGGYWYDGLDFAKGTLVGCFVVAINFFVSQRLVGNLILEKSLKPYLLIAYLMKFGVSALILFVAIVKFKVDEVGVMLGLSSILLSTMFSALVRKQPDSEDELKS